MSAQWNGWIRRTIEGQNEGPAPAQPVAQAPRRETIIDHDCALEGNLQLPGPLTVNGEFKGAIDCQEDVTVGAHGTVEGPIRARSVEIRGSVVGNLEARREIVLCAGSRLHGDVQSPSLVIERGARFEGRTTQTQPIALRPLAADAPAEPSRTLPPGA